MAKEDQIDDSDLAHLYDFWQDLPLIKKISSDTYEVMLSHPLRSSITQLLRQGIIDDSTGEKRYALTIAELVPLIEDRLGQEFKRTALYHHRDILLDHGLIQEVVTLLEGKRYVTYYGRTAKAFVGEEGTSSSDGDELLIQLLGALQPGMSQKKLTSLVQELNQDRKIAHDEVLQWIEQHVRIINQLDLDAIDIYHMILPYFLQQFSSTQKLLDLLNQDSNSTIT